MESETVVDLGFPMADY